MFRIIKGNETQMLSHFLQNDFEELPDASANDCSSILVNLQKKQFWKMNPTEEVATPKILGTSVLTINFNDYLKHTA